MTAERRSLRALVYGDVDLNMIDGSAIWLQSTVEVLVRAGCQVTLVLKASARTGQLLDPITALPDVTVVGRTDQELGTERVGPWLDPKGAARVMRRLDAEDRYDLIVVRGYRVAVALADEPSFVGRLWTYLTDMPQSVARLGPAETEPLQAIVRASRVMLCQTEDLRSFLETAIPDAVGRTAILPPVVPSFSAAAVREPLTGRPVRLVYSGKFAPLWKTLEMASLPDRLARRGVAAELHIIGDKVHADPDDPTYAERMRAALDGPGVVWHGARSRQEAMTLAATADIGLSWRAPALDASLELSTKILEFGSMDIPVVLNRTPMHERLLGRDYPLFVSDVADVEDAIVEAVGDGAMPAEATERCRAAAAAHTLERGVERVRELLARSFPAPLSAIARDRPVRIGIASHDLKFFTRIQEHLERLPDVEVRFDHWPALNVQDEPSSQALLDWADLIVCEWCGPNAVWYSERVRPGQRLVVRLHRFELYGSWPARVAIDRVDRVVCVSRSYATLTGSMTGWPAAKITIIPNWVDDRALDRPKLDGAEFDLGFIGMAPARKRLDKALDVLEALRLDDPRFKLSVKSKMPWDYPWIWRDPVERRYTDDIMRRVQTSELLRGAVVFDPFGPDVASWLRRIGFVLSTSDDESFHLAPAEGMASGAVPMLLDWPGSDTIYDRHWIHRSPEGMADAIAAIVRDGRWTAEASLARDQAAAFSLDTVTSAWSALLADVLERPLREPVATAGGAA